MPMIPQPPNPAMFDLAPPDQRAEMFMQVTDGIKAAQIYNEQQPRLKTKWDGAVKEQAIDNVIEGMRDDNIAEFGLKVVTSASTPSSKLLNWLKEQDIQDRYPGIIPPDMFIEDSDLPRKDEIVARMRGPAAENKPADDYAGTITASPAAESRVKGRDDESGCQGGGITPKKEGFYGYDCEIQGVAGKT